MSIEPAKNLDNNKSQTAHLGSSGTSSASSQSLQSKATVALVSSLARKGELSQAASLLAPLVNDSEASLDSLDLLAKIYAQQGRTVEAQSLWLRAVQKDPSNLHFIEALRTCADVQRLRAARPRVAAVNWSIIGFSIAFIIVTIVIAVLSLVR